MTDRDYLALVIEHLNAGLAASKAGDRRGVVIAYEDALRAAKAGRLTWQIDALTGLLKTAKAIGEDDD